MDRIHAWTHTKQFCRSFAAPTSRKVLYDDDGHDTSLSRGRKSRGGDSRPSREKPGPDCV